MTLPRNGLSASAETRIRTFWILLWGLSSFGFIIIVVGLLVSGTADRYARPWDAANPTAAESDDGGRTWHGTGNSLVRMTEEEFGDQPRLVTLTAGYSMYLYIGDHDETFGDDYYYPSFWDGVYQDSPTMLLPPGRDLELWVEAEEPWSFTFDPVETLTVEDRLTGEGPAFIAYRGSASSAKIDIQGDGILSVQVLTATETSFNDSEIDRFSQRVFWEASSIIILQIESTDPRAKWIVDIDLLADEQPLTPGSTTTPVPDMSPTPQPSASATPGATTTT